MLSLFAGLAACGKSSGQTAPSSAPAVSPASSGAAPEVSSAAESKPEEKKPQLSGLLLTAASSYSDGLAWVQYKKDGKTVASIVDTSGNITGSITPVPSYMSGFRDGYSHIHTESDKKTGDSIIDKTGKEIFRTGKDAPSSVTEEHILGYGGGMFFLWRRQAGITANFCEIAAIKPDGTTVYDFTSDFTVSGKEGTQKQAAQLLDDSVFKHAGAGSILSLGEDWYRFQCEGELGVYFNLAKKMISGGPTPLSSGCSFLGTFQDGRIYVVDSSWVYPFDTSLNRLGNDANHYERVATPYDSQSYELSDGIFFMRKKLIGQRSYATGYYDIFGNPVLAVNSYPDNSVRCSPFANGYAIMKITGADSKEYVTAIDKNAEVQFEPIPHLISSDERIAGGYLILSMGKDDWQIFDMKGKFVHSLSGDFKGCTVTGVKSGGEGYIIVHYHAKDTSFFKLYPVAKAAAAGSSVYDLGTLDESFETVSSAAASSRQTQSAAHSYVTMNNFSIEGKWKSVGSYGFGQAQPGAIVIFNGTHCNFFSPSDTYALISKNGKYELDVTSFGSTDSLSFTVGIIDANHIDLKRNGYTTELQRVG